MMKLVAAIPVVTMAMPWWWWWWGVVAAVLAAGVVVWVGW